VGLIVQLGGGLINYTAVYDYWTKIGRLYWSEADIHLLPSVTTHLKAMAAISPGKYDLWVVQAYKTSPAAICALLLLLLGMALAAAWPLIRNRPDGEGPDRS
jgi:hypothetical protein